jgi:hypothetical protein
MLAGRPCPVNCFLVLRTAGIAITTTLFTGVGLGLGALAGYKRLADIKQFDVVVCAVVCVSVLPRFTIWILISWVLITLSYEMKYLLIYKRTKY